MPPELVQLSLDDARQMAAIASQAHTHPMSITTIQSCFSHLYSVFGLTHKAELLGFAIVHQIFEDVTLIDICVSPEYQEQGFGRSLLEAVISKARSDMGETLFLEVRASSIAARALYSKYGFVEAGSRKGYYKTADGVEDAILMELSL